MAENNQLEKIRHSCSHVLAAAVSKLYPRVKLAIGPAIEDGFYYDFDFGQKKISEKDLAKISKEMEKIIKTKAPFKKENVTIEKAKAVFKNQSFKLELIADLVKEEKVKKVSLYQTGDFVDLCAGPHVTNTSKIGPFQLLSIAGAYWRGDEKKPMLTRLYGACFTTKKALDEHLKILEEAKERDHRKLNYALKLYQISNEMGQGLVTLLPNGTIIAEELENWAKKTEEEWGYIRVMTPHIAKESLFKKTGHVPHYLESMYPPMRMKEKGAGETDLYYLKPMNCSMHALVFKSEPKSYRDLPLRIAEYGTVYRYEKSGELHGMMRVRGPIHQNDAHIFCTEEQAEEEFQKVMELHQYYYKTLGLSEKDYYLSYATRDEKNKGKFLGNDKMWEKAQKITLKYVKQSKIPYEIEEGGAAFYGPKIDFNIKTVTGKVFSASTNQLDFFIPQVFNLKYADKDGKQKTPVCIHRAPLGAHVRFIAFLTEHYAGAFPVWLSPVQAIVVPITDKHNLYGQKIVEQLNEENLRVKIDTRNETTSAKIRDAELQKIPYILVVGDKERKAKNVNVRVRGEKSHGPMSVLEFTSLIKEDIAKKRQV
ncbi:MAG: threonine--tRNA ligase [Candidatus Marinimicrobia bacterium]|nr:threonine--tRNA ligase [Candidatus Neomarinimicrobiota bacterium]